MAIEACFTELGLTSDANLTEVNKAFKKIAITTHPDKNNDPAAADKFRTVNNAYATLLDWFRDNPPKGRRTQDESPDSSDVKVTEHSQCIVVKIGKSKIQHFMDACYELYGEPRDLGKHGQKYSATFKSLDPENEGNSTPNRLGSVHVTVYKGTGNVMAQGACSYYGMQSTCPIYYNRYVQIRQHHQAHLNTSQSPPLPILRMNLTPTKIVVYATSGIPTSCWSAMRVSCGCTMPAPRYSRSQGCRSSPAKDVQSLYVGDVNRCQSQPLLRHPSNTMHPIPQRLRQLQTLRTPTLSHTRPSLLQSPAWSAT